MRISRLVPTRIPWLVTCLGVVISTLACGPRTGSDDVVIAEQEAAPPSDEGAAGDAPDPAWGNDESPTLETLDDDRHVLLWTNAPLYRSPDGDAPVRAFGYDDSERVTRPGQAYVARLLDERGDWVKIATGPVQFLTDDGASRHCIGATTIFGAAVVSGSGEDTVYRDAVRVALEMWVHRDDLMPVLTETFERTYDDGTFVRLYPGTPVVDGKPWVEGFHLPVAVPAAKLGWTYTPQADTSERKRRGFSLEDATDVRAKLGGKPVAWSQPVHNYADPPMVWVNTEGNRLTESGNGCGVFELTFHGELVEGDRSKGIGGMGMMRSGKGEPIPAVVLPQRTPLTWPDGSRAGVVTDRMTLRDRRAEGEVCFDVTIGYDSKADGFVDDAVEVCAAEKDVEEITVPARR